jgi:hypothetical protein
MSGPGLSVSVQVERNRHLSHDSIAGHNGLPCRHSASLEISVNTDFVISRRHTFEDELPS